MMRRLALAALFTSLPAAAPAAQSQENAAGVVRPASPVAQPQASAASGQLAAVCDGSEMRNSEHRRRVGKAVSWGALLGGGVAIVATLQNPPQSYEGGVIVGRRQMAIALGSVSVAAFGAVMAATSDPDEAFWQRTLSRAKVGETRSEQVRTCLHEPWGTSSTGLEERWTYAWARGGSLHTVSFTFKDSVLSEVRRSRVTLPADDSASPTVTLPIPDPITGSPPPR
ncbi:MAG TPA: hypothetical protein VKA84_29410 [Gemmatimonadaceae bacterium]|nr:hypothetical protein [Gemmatimonadaceae bacterium]